MDWSFEQQQEGPITESSQQEHRRPFLTGKPCGATCWLCASRGVRTERPDVSRFGIGSQWSSALPQWGGHSQIRRHLVLSLWWRPLCQSPTLPGTPLHADRIDSTAGCMSRICQVAVTECWPRALDSDLCML